MSQDDLTITLRGQEAYDYLQWRAERYKEERQEIARLELERERRLRQAKEEREKINRERQEELKNAPF